MLISDFGIVLEICGFLFLLILKQSRDTKQFDERSRTNANVIWSELMRWNSEYLKKFHWPESIAILSIIIGLMFQWSFYSFIDLWFLD